MTDAPTNPSGPSTSRSLPPPSPSVHSPVKLHAMSTRSSDALATRRPSIQQQQPQAPQYSVSSSPPAAQQQPPEAHGLPSVEGRLTRKRARSINVEQANHSRVDELSLQSPALGNTTPGSISASDLICICPSPPKVPRPRNAFILYRQHHQAGVVQEYPRLANPDISKIIGEQWREEDEPTKNYWKRLAEEEKARHQRQYPQYKYQPRRGGKGGPAARPASAAGEDPGRCPKCGGRYIATPRTPSTPFGPVPGHGGLGLGPGPGSGASMQPFIANNPRILEAPQHHHHHHQQQQQQQQQHRQSVDSQHSGGGFGDPRRQSSYYSHPHEPMRPIDEDYDAGGPPGMSRRRGPPQQDDFDMMTSPDLKRRRFGHLDRSPDHGSSPMAAVPQHHGHGQQQYHPVMSSQPPYPPQQYQQQQQQHPGSRRGSAISIGGTGPYPGTPGGGNYQIPVALPRPRAVGGGPSGGPQQPQQQQQQQQQQMAPPPRPARLGPATGVPPPPPGLPARAGQPGFDESLTLAPLQIPPSSPTQTSDASGGGGGGGGGGSRSLSGGGLGIIVAGGARIDTQASGVEAMVMCIPYMNKLDVLKKISPPLGPPAPGSPGAETRGPVIAIEGGDPVLMREVRPMIERALRSSGECELKVWADSSVERPVSPSAPEGPAKKAEDVEMADAQERAASHASGSRHNSVGGASSSGGNNTPTPRPGPAYAPPTLQPPSVFDYIQTMMAWHIRSAEMIRHVTTRPPPNDNPAAGRRPTTPVALIAGGFSLTLSDRFATTVPITDPYSPVDHWQWMATLWRGIVGADLVVYVRAMTPDEVTHGAGTVEYCVPGVMVVRVAGDRVDEKTERRLAFEVMEWVRAGSFREGYSFAGEAG